MPKLVRSSKNHSKALLPLLGDIRHMIEQTKSAVAATANAGLTILNWRIGKRLKLEILKDKRAEYGAQIIATLSNQLTKDYGQGFTRFNLARMIKFFECFSDQKIVATLSQQLGWSHFVEIIPLKDPLQRDFYAEMCRVERWSVRTLREKIGSLLFERTALSKKPEKLAKLELAKLREFVGARPRYPQFVHRL